MPLSENAALEFLAAVNEFRAASVPGDFPDRVDVQRFSREQRQIALADLQRFETTFSAAKRAARLEKLDLRRDYEKGPALLFPEYQGAKGVVKALTLRARLQSADGKPIQALADLRTAAGFSALTHDQPDLIACLVRNKNETTILLALQEVVTSHARDQDVLEQAGSVINALGPFPVPKRVFAFEVASSVNWPRTMAVEAASPPDPRYPNCTPFDPLVRVPQVVRANETHAIEYWRDVYRTLPNSPEEFPKALEGYDQVVLKYTDRRGLGYVFQGITMPAYSKALRTLAAMGSARAVSQAGVKTLARDSSTPLEMPIDPLTGERLHIKRTRNGFRIWSVGVNLQDEGGQSRFLDPESRSDDIVFEYPLRPFPTRVVRKHPISSVDR
jgi:hypothetical protein